MEHDMELLRKNTEEIKARIAHAALKSGRTPGDIKLIAVTKTIELERIQGIINLGLRSIGENRVQEIQEKYDHIQEKCEWHLIGHLQTNKVKYIIDKIHMIHSVDNLELASEIQKRAEKTGRTIDVLVQVNVAGEETKFGLEPREVLAFVKEISPNRNIKVKGLMTIAPYVEDPEEVRPVFADLKKIFDGLKRENIPNTEMQYLSMGMSNDFEVAIEEGANMVRIGTAIFGDRT